MGNKSSKKLDPKKLIASTVSAAVVVSPVSGSFVADAAENSFKDVSKDAYYFEAVQDLVKKGVVSGYPDGTFKPNGAVTRAEFSAFLVKILNLDTSSVNNPNFKDVDTNAWYYKSVAALANMGLVKGYEDGTFQPNKKITRAEIAALLTRVCNLSADPSVPLPFKDVPENAWYKEVVAALYQSKLVAGKTETTFAPNDNTTRAEAVVFLHRADSKGLLAQGETGTIEAVTNEGVTINGVTYQISDQVKGILNAANSTVLKNAFVTFSVSNQQITKILSLKITASGQAAQSGEKEFSRNIVLDGANQTIDGNLIIAGDFVTVKNVKVGGDFEITNQVQHDFYSENLTVAGKTIINGGDSNTVVLNGKFKNVEVGKPEVRVEITGNSTVEDLVVSSNATIVGDENVVLPKLTVTGDVEKLNLQVKVEHVVVDTTKEISIDGTSIGNLELVKPVKITLAPGTKIENLVIPENVDVKDIITNYDEVKNSITKINDKQNPDVPVFGGGGGGGGGGTVTPKATIAEISIGNYKINQPGNSFSVNLKDINDNKDDLFSATLNVTQASSFKINIPNLGTLGDFKLVQGTNTINLIDISKMDVDNLNFGTIKTLLENPNVSKLEVYKAIHFDKILDEIKKDQDTKDLLKGVINSHNEKDALWQAYEQGDYDVILEKFTKNDFIKVFGILAVSNVPRDQIFNAAVIDLQKIINAMGGTSGFKTNIFPILAQLDGDSDNSTLTVGAELTNSGGTTNYTIQFKIEN